MVTRKDVAQKAGVSEATVSYVINNTKSITPEVRDRVLSVIQELNYRPNLVARSLVTKQTRHVALMVDNLKNPHYCEILEGAQSIASKAGYIVSVISINVSNKDDVLELAGRGVDGIILALGSKEKDRNDFSNLHIPCVWIDDNVYVDYKKAIFDMVECLKSKGHRNIGFLSGIPINNPAHVRYKDFIKALQYFGLEVNHNLIVDAQSDGDTDENAGELAMKELLLRKEEFTAVFAINDLMALGASKAIRDADLKLPQDISLVGCDHLKILDKIEPSLSTLDAGAFQIGCALMHQLIAKIKGDPHFKQSITAEFLCKDSIYDLTKYD
ncbi:substrate-binding domain-containing protein [Anaerocolumna sedimenticola]|uniref:Substrate-binding domain-containing protein n=1 Tax=Anaerocolumna sedimenticola TaxID=2696063 RepID=A0A6P1TNZ4_9FIRM|nr:LacI family DNA-binding transcriptional regulator [Anaerocolumna sedimenticola]QHQ62980.1 substrate-binding domain-containing protein [Anaerocolumna sedimenticola]